MTLLRNASHVLMLQDDFREILKEEFVCPKRQGINLRRCAKREQEWVEEQFNLRYKVLTAHHSLLPAKLGESQSALRCCADVITYAQAVPFLSRSFPSCHVIVFHLRVYKSLKILLLQNEVMKKLECWNAGTYVCYKEQIDKWDTSQRSKADKLWLQYLEIIAHSNSITSAHHKTVFIDKSVDVEYHYLLLSNCLDTADGHDYNEAVESIKTEQSKVAFIDKTVDPVYYSVLRFSCLFTESGRDYSIALEERDAVDTITKEIDTDVHQKANDTAIVDESVTISYKSKRFSTDQESNTLNNATYSSRAAIIVIPLVNTSTNTTCIINGVSSIKSAAHVRLNNDSSIIAEPLTPLLESIITAAVNNGTSTVVSNCHTYYLHVQSLLEVPLSQVLSVK
eukprot:4125-Heterococcus_DN1.PRE.8